MFVQVEPNAREFLSRALPWTTPGGPPSYVNIHYKITLPNLPLPVFPGTALVTVDDALRNLQYSKRRNTDIYVCMGAQAQCEPKTSPKGFHYNKAIRRQDQTRAMKSLYVDVDVKPDAYSSTTEAATEFGRIRRELGLPPCSMTIASGSGGFHAYWIFDHEIPVEQWQPLAFALVAGLKAKGFRGDSGCSIDCVRLLRIPGTFNHKGTPPTMVDYLGRLGPDYAVADIEAILKPYVGLLSTPTARVSPANDLGPVSALFSASKVAGADLAAGIEVNHHTIDEVALGCPFIAATLLDGGKDHAQPLWMHSINVSLFVKDSRAAAHRLSCGHPGYSAADTDAMFDRKLAEKQARNMGWPRCHTISANGSAQCATCPHFTKGQSPLNFVPAQAPPVITAALMASSGGAAPQPVELPPGYCINADGMLCEILVDDAGVQSIHVLVPFAVDQPWLQGEPPTLNFTTVTFQGNSRQIRLPYETIADAKSLGKAMAKQGMLIRGGSTKDIGDFFVAWVDTLRKNRANVIQNVAFGWHVVHGKVEGFVFAGHVWSKDQPKPAMNTDAMLQSQYQPEGELEPWKEAMAMITNQKRPALEAMTAVSFAAPLVRFVGQTGLLLSTYSTESGIGKSTAQRVGAAVWSHPQKSTQSLSDTQNSVINKLGALKNLPLFWDELKGEEDTRKFMHLSFQLSTGKEKSRLAADTSQREPGTWQTMLCATSNDSLLAYVMRHTKTTTAGLYRVFEYAVTPGVTGQIGPAEAMRISGKLNEHYGHAGLLYAQFLGANYERVEREVHEYSDSLEKAYNVQADERFWIATVAVIVMGAHYANELGLAQFDIPALQLFMGERFMALRRTREASTADLSKPVNVLQHLGGFINAKRMRHTIVTDMMHRGAGRPTHNIVPAHDPSKLITIDVHMSLKDKWCRVSRPAFEQWLEDQDLTPALVLKQLTEQFAVAQIRGKLAAGTWMSTATGQVLEFNWGQPEFNEFIDPT